MNAFIFPLGVWNKAFPIIIGQISETSCWQWCGERLTSSPGLKSRLYVNAVPLKFNSIVDCTLHIFNMCLHSALLLTFLAVATGKPIAQSLFVEDSTNSFTSDYKPVGISHTKKDALIAEIIFPSISEPDCSSTALTDQIIDGTYQEQNLWRRQACSTSPKTPKKRTKKQDATPSTGLAQQQLEMNQPATETVVNPCAGQAQDRYVTCGG